VTVEVRKMKRGKWKGRRGKGKGERGIRGETQGDAQSQSQRVQRSLRKAAGGVKERREGKRREGVIHRHSHACMHTWH